MWVATITASATVNFMAGYELGRTAHEAVVFGGLGGSADADPQAALISRMTLGRIAAGDVGLLVTLLLVGMVELISAFAPVVVHEYVLSARAVAASRRRASTVAAGRDSPRVIEGTATAKSLTAGATDLFPYLADRVVPDAKGSETVDDVFVDYCTWCGGKSMSPLPEQEFVEKLDEIAQADLGGRVVRKGSEYFGLRLLGVGHRVFAGNGYSQT